ncbi:hypothetical protein Taro_054105 [Colocasia esculenta]|uniref:Uncharacterized protein n=1 Tax=Colocasia esculenta TaxID=4460 RepID=A0A843XPH8_COLES|nr:hypothetical protein [Colocasia esculenta]
MEGRVRGEKTIHRNTTGCGGWKNQGLGTDVSSHNTNMSDTIDMDVEESVSLDTQVRDKFSLYLKK